MNLKAFNTCRKKSVVKVDKVVKLRENRQLLAQSLVVQQARSSMIESLSETIGKYEFSVIQRLLYSSDGLFLTKSHW